MELTLAVGHDNAKHVIYGRLLLEAVKSGDEQTARRLLEEGGSRIGAKTSDGDTALHLAVSQGNEAITSLLLEYGADTNAESDNKKRPLYIAAEQGNQTITKLLLQYNAQVESLNSTNKTTALFQACEGGHIETAQILLDHGSNIDAKRSDGQTPLFRAVALGNLKLTELLLRHGANKEIRLPDGKSVTDFAEDNPAIKLALDIDQVLQGPAIVTPKRGPETQLGPVRSLPPPSDDEVDKLNACHGFQATVVQFFVGEREQRIQLSTSIYELLYGKGPTALLNSAREGKIASQEPSFTWYHLPANNVRVSPCLLQRDSSNTSFRWLGLRYESLMEIRLFIQPHDHQWAPQVPY